MTDKELRELDEWIAEHVMGGFFNGHHWLRKDNLKLCLAVGGDAPSYSTDPAAAMMVLEKCIKFDNNTMIWRAPTYFECETAGHYFVHQNHLGKLCSTNAKTLPLAICLFAKKLHESK